MNKRQQPKPALAIPVRQPTPAELEAKQALQQSTRVSHTAKLAASQPNRRY